MISIIDYGLGNVQAFINAYTRLDIPVNIAKNTDDLVSTKKIIGYQGSLVLIGEGLIFQV